jgi:hypothetical protein
MEATEGVPDSGLFNDLAEVGNAPVVYQCLGFPALHFPLSSWRMAAELRSASTEGFSTGASGRAYDPVMQEPVVYSTLGDLRRGEFRISAWCRECSREDWVELDGLVRRLGEAYP